MITGREQTLAEGSPSSARAEPLCGGICLSAGVMSSGGATPAFQVAVTSNQSYLGWQSMGDTQKSLGPLKTILLFQLLDHILPHCRTLWMKDEDRLSILI